MNKKVKGRVVSSGIAEGEALICTEPIGFNFGVNLDTGEILEKNHSLEGISIKDKILIFPYGKGSTGGSYVVYAISKNKTGPRAMINLNTETIIAVGAIMGKIPVMDHLEENPFDIIENGDYVKVNAVDGYIEIIKKGDQ
ncbi:MAG TPA: DUF126 domain-containing protein [Gallicola sp.]|nr:DUF126 domain-containing protein [Gallicola sp.]